MRQLLLIGAIGCLGITAAASADFAIVDNLGGPVIINGGEFAGLLTTPTEFSEADLLAIHADLAGSGISTDGMITFLLAQTSSGLSFITLVDQPSENGIAGGVGFTDLLGFSTTGDDDLLAFINDDGADNIQVFNLGNGTQVATGAFEWNSANQGDGFAWGGLKEGDFLSYHFTDLETPGLGNAPFQFLNYNGNDWEVAATGAFSPNDQFVFSLTVVPGPGALALFSVTGFLGARRRRA